MRDGMYVLTEAIYCLNELYLSDKQKFTPRGAEMCLSTHILAAEDRKWFSR